MKLNGAQIVLEQLIANGVNTVFGYPGGAVLALYDELYKYADKIEHVLTAHEQGAAHAADGYARASGKTGVVIATSGPGATNLVTGIANAYLDSVPMVAITGNVPLSIHGKDSFQEVDVIGITGAIVKHSFVVRDIKDLEHTLNEAFRLAGSGRRGPVLVDIPRNVQTDSYDYFGRVAEIKPVQPCNFDPAQLADRIKGCKRPFIYAGGGVLASNAQKELEQLAEKLNSPVGFSMMGLTALPTSHPRNLGMCGMHGEYVSTLAQSECDLLIAVGVRFSDRATGNVVEYEKDKLIIHIDIDHAEIGKNVAPHISVCGDIREVLAQLLPLLPELETDDWLAHIDRIKRSKEVQKFRRDDFNPQNIIAALGRSLPADTLVATDVGQHQMWAVQYYDFKRPCTLLTSGGLGAMGYGLGAAIGGCMALGGRRTILITGDGSFGMNLIELAAAVQYRLPIVVILLNNKALGLPKQWQHAFFGDRFSHSILDERRTDFVALAKAFGARGHLATSIDELESLLADLPKDCPAVIDCPIDEDEVVMPMIPPGGSVKNMILKG